MQLNFLTSFNLILMKNQTFKINSEVLYLILTMQIYLWNKSFCLFQHNLFNTNMSCRLLILNLNNLFIKNAYRIEGKYTQIEDTSMYPSYSCPLQIITFYSVFAMSFNCLSKKFTFGINLNTYFSMTCVCKTPCTIQLKWS